MPPAEGPLVLFRVKGGGERAHFYLKKGHEERKKSNPSL